MSTMNSWVKGLVSDYNADGVRIDTVKHVRKDFWPAFASSAGTFTIGEVLSNETSYVAPYTQVLDGVLDYPMWYPLVAGFQTPYGNLSYLAEVFATSQSVYKNGEKFSGSFLENHDQPRFQSLTQDQAVSSLSIDLRVDAYMRVTAREERDGVAVRQRWYPYPLLRPGTSIRRQLRSI